MELSKPQEPLRHKYRDVTFLVRAEALESDRLEIWGSGSISDGKVMTSKADFVKTVIRCLVIGWEGVTEDGKPVPYSMEALARLPYQGNSEPVFLDLFNFIMENTGLKGPSEAEKNASREQPIGS